MTTKKQVRAAMAQPQLVAYQARIVVTYQRTRDIAVRVEGWDKRSMLSALTEIVGERQAREVFDTLRGTP